jgi:hypothetical protein
MAKTLKQNNRAELASSIAAVLANPETPVELYNEIRDILSVWSSDYLKTMMNTPAYIESCLETREREETEETKGGRK